MALQGQSAAGPNQDEKPPHHQALKKELGEYFYHVKCNHTGLRPPLPVAVDDDLGWVGHIEVCVVERLLAELLGTVHVGPGQQQVLDLQLEPLLSILLPGCVVQVCTLYFFLYTCGDMAC